MTYTTSYVWTLTIEWYKIFIFNPNYQPHDLKKYKDEFNCKSYYNVTYTTSWVWSLTIKWYKIFISNPNYQLNMIWKSIKMNLIANGSTTWPILQVGFEPWPLNSIDYLYPKPNYQSNMTWKSIKMNLIVKGITTWPILQVEFEP